MGAGVEQGMDGETCSINLHSTASTLKPQHTFRCLLKRLRGKFVCLHCSVYGLNASSLSRIVVRHQYQVNASL